MAAVAHLHRRPTRGRPVPTCSSWSGATGEQQFVPFCVRDDTSTAAVVIQQSVTTWQAYNRWGGYSLYYGNADGSLSFTHAPGDDSTYDARARIVSFDRPYDYDWANGAADFVGNEFPVVYHAEQLGLDVTYWTDVDFHLRPQLLTNHKALLSLGHDEYWSTPMRNGADQAVAAGVNLAFLGANACYRQIRFQPSPIGPNRQQVCYKDAVRGPDDRPERRPGHGQLAATAGRPARGPAHRSPPTRTSKPMPTASSPIRPTGSSTAPGSPPASTSPSSSKASSTATSPAVPGRPTST